MKLEGTSRQAIAAVTALALALLVTPVAAIAQNAYITNQGVYPNFSNNVTVIDTATNKIVTTIGVGLAPSGVAVTPDGKKAYVANRAVSGTVSVIDTATNAVSATITVGSNPVGVAVKPDGSKVYVASQGRHSTLSVIDTATDTVSATIDVGPTPFGVAVTPDGRKVFVAHDAVEGVVSVIDTATNAVSATIGVGPAPIALGVFIMPPKTLPRAADSPPPAPPNLAPASKRK